MKLFKKTLCVIMSALMLFTGLSVGLVGYAANTALDESYKSLAYSFVNYTQDTSLGSNDFIVTKDDAGVPSLTILGDLDNYTTSTESGNYEYADTDGSAIRAVSYTHKVTAKDNGSYTIRKATNSLLTIVDSIISYEYGQGLYTIPMIIEEITDELMYFKGDDGEYLFLDGYTYYKNTVGELVARSEDKTYYVEDDGDIVYNTTMTDDESDADEFAALVEAGVYVPVTLWEACHVDTIIKYMCGNCTSVNSGNWFHDFEFYVYTDEETVLLEEGQNIKNSELTVYETHIKWTNGRQFDDSGLKAQYYNLGYEKEETKTTSQIRVELTKLRSQMNKYFSKYYPGTTLDLATNANLIDTYYPDITSGLAVFNSISDNAKIAVFGQKAYSYVNLVTQLTPIVGAINGNADDYAPVHTYDKYTDRYGNNVQFKVTTENITSLVTSIDKLLSNKSVTKVLAMFLDLSEFGVDLEANNNATPYKVINMIIQNMVFSDDIVNMILTLIYPMITNLLDDLITDEFIETTLKKVWTGLASVVNSLIDNAHSWQAMIYGALTSIGIALTPAGVAWVWNKYGYMDSQYKYTTTFENFQYMHDYLKACKGGVTSSGAGHSTGDYCAIGDENDGYSLARWDMVDTSELVWNINGDKSKFLMALDAILAPLAPLLAVLLGNSKCTIFVTTLLGTDLYLVLNNQEDSRYDLYNRILLPLLETLGIRNLMSGSDFEALADETRADTDRNPTTIGNFLNKGLLNPILNWVTDDLLTKPIETVLTLLPNISYYLTSGALLSSLDGLEVPIVIRWDGINWITGNIKVYTLDIMELIGKDKIAFLDSLQGVLDLISFDIDTGEGIVGYYDPSGTSARVYTPSDADYDASKHTEPVSIAYMKESNGNLNRYKTSEYATQVTAMDEDGNYTSYALRNDVGYIYTETGKIVDNKGSNEELYVPIKEYYQYSVTTEYYDPDAKKIIYTTSVYKVETLDEVPEEYKKECKKVESFITIEEEISLPAIMDYKLQACGTLKEVDSGRYGTFTMTDREGNSNTWAATKRMKIDMKVYDQNGNYDSYGLVFLFLLRYILSALGYSEYSESKSDFVSEYTILDAFGLNDEALGDELISGLGLTLGDIIYHVCLNPDAIIASLFELLIGGEEGSLYTIDEVYGVLAGKDYSYAPTTIEYYTEEILQAAEDHNDFQYGTAVLYNEYWTREDAEYVVDNLDDIVENVLAMLKMDDLDSLSGLLSDLLDDMVFNNEMVTMIVSMVYNLLGSMSFDIGTLLEELLGVDYSKQALLDSIAYMFKDVDYTSIEMYQKLQYQINKDNYDYTDYTFSKATVDRETGEVVVGDSYDWGFNNPEVTAKYSNSEIFLRALSAAFGPFSILVEYIFMGEDIVLLDLVHIPMYEIYQYAWIPLMEALGATDGLSTFKDYYTSVFANEAGDVAGGTCAFYYLLKPIIELADNLVASPIETVLNMIPNLIFVLSIGGLNDIINNIAHFAYVLLDILEPIVDVYPVLNSFLSNLEIGGITLNLALPLDVDLNQLVNELLDGLLGSALSFEIKNKNVVLGTQTVLKEVDVPVVDADGNQVLDTATGLPLTTKEMQTVTEDVYAVGVLSITLPYLDLTTLCSGTIQKKSSKGGYDYVYLNSAGGADFITLVLRLVTDTLFYKENWENISTFLIGFCDLDDADDNDALLMEIMMFIHSKAQDARMNDQLMKLILTIYKVLVPLADNLGQRFKNVDFSITDMFSDMDNIGYYASQLKDASGEKNETLTGFAKLINLIKEFFAKISQFFANMFGG